MNNKAQRVETDDFDIYPKIVGNHKETRRSVYIIKTNDQEFSWEFDTIEEAMVGALVNKYIDRSRAFHAIYFILKMLGIKSVWSQDS